MQASTLHMWACVRVTQGLAQGTPNTSGELLGVAARGWPAGLPEDWTSCSVLREAAQGHPVALEGSNLTLQGACWL